MKLSSFLLGAPLGFSLLFPAPVSAQDPADETKPAAMLVPDISK